MLAVELTPLGGAVVMAMLLGVLLTHGVLRRQAGSERRIGCMGYVVGGPLMAMLMVAALMMSLMVGKNVVGVITKPSHRATMASFTSESTESRDSKGKVTRSTMFTPTVTFVAEDGTRETVPTDVSSGSAPYVGTEVTVLHAPGDTVALEMSGAKLILMLVMGLLLSLVGSVIYAALQISRGAATDGVRRFVIGLALNGIAPLALFGMFAGMARAVWQYFAGTRPTMPIWAVVMCCFFCAVILAVTPKFVRLIVMLNGLWRGGPGPVATQAEPPAIG